MHQTSYVLGRETLRGALLVAVQSERGGGGGFGSVECRASAALYALLGDHHVDRRGRCRCCRDPRVLRGRRRRVCRVLVAAQFYLHQPDNVLLCQLASELDQPIPASRGVLDHEATEVLPRLAAHSIGPQTQRPQAPAVPPPPAPGGSPRARRPDPDQRTAPSQDTPLVVTEGATWPT